VIRRAVTGLLPLAELWGLRDDVERFNRVNDASLDDLRAMVAAVDAVPDDELYGWLAGRESFGTPLPEYVEITYLTMAADQARLRLRDAPPLV